VGFWPGDRDHRRLGRGSVFPHSHLEDGDTRVAIDGFLFADFVLAHGEPVAGGLDIWCHWLRVVVGERG